MKGSPKGDSFVIGQNIALQTHSRGPAWPDRSGAGTHGRVYEGRKK